MYDKKSGLAFLQRTGLVPTYLNPEPRIEPRSWSIHSASLEAPLPLPNLLSHIDGDTSPPDRGQTYEWPHPEANE